MKDFLQALSFLTILPVGPSFPLEGKSLARSMAYFPLVGLLIGLFLVLGNYLFSLLFPRSLVIWLLIGLLVFLTRGLHLDGLADTIDGLASGGERERILEVMRDSRIGAFGVISLIFLLGAKYFALDQITNVSIPYTLILMPVSGRNSMVVVCYRSPYARSGNGLGRPFTEHLGIREVTIALLSSFTISLLTMGIKGVWVFLGICLFSAGYRFFFIRRLGGVTGDILGGANEFAELLSLLLILLVETYDSS